MKNFSAKTKYILISVLCALLAVAAALFVCSVIPHGQSANAGIKDTNVEYKSVEKVIKIDENKSCDITEIITVQFKQSNINLGLSRNVSRINKITRIADGKKYVNTTKNDLQLYSVTLNGAEEYSFVETRGDYFYINTGADGDYKQAGTYVYEIHYRYDMSYDFIKKFDDFTFDIMDYGFRGAVEKFSASVTLPKTFLTGEDVSEVLTFRTNEMAPLTYNEVEARFDADNLTVSCSFGRLEAGNGLTMQLILPQGYFNNTYTPSPLYWVTLACTVAAVVAIAVIIFTSRHVRNVVVTTEIYPPEGYSPLDVGRCFRGRIRSKDFAALIISWANRGLVSIEFKSKKHIILRRLKRFDCNTVTQYSKYERDFFNSLFGFANIFDSKTKKRNVTNSDRLYESVKKLYKLKPEQTRQLIFKRLAVSLISIIPIIMSLIWHSDFMGGVPVMIAVLLFPLLALNVFIYIPMPIWFKILWGSIFGGVTFFAVFYTTFGVYDILYLGIVTAVIFVLGTFSTIFVCAYGDEEKKMRGAVLGFKKFLVLAELDKLNALLEDNPEYFYDILPYCYVFGITEKMEKKFAALNVERPKYLEGNSVSSFGRCVSSSMRSVCGGSHGGGGSSGGSGGGGGGGGSSGGGGGGGGCGGR